MAKSPSTAGQRRGGNPALRLAAIRQWHTMIGVFIAPCVIFFAFTGVVQIFSLHEARGGYHPPALIEGLGSVHKDQVFRVKPERPAPAQAPSAAAPSHPDDASAGHDHDDADHADHADADHAGHDHVAAAPADHASAKPKGQPIKVYALKWLFTFVAIGLATSTGLGLWMALSYGRNKRTLWALLAAGIVLPILLVVI